MNKAIKSLLLPLAMSCAFAIPLVSSTPNAQAAPRTVVQTPQGSYKCHKTGILRKKLSCVKVRPTTRR